MMKTLSLILSFLVSLTLPAQKAVAANTLKTFITDGCTMFIDGPLKQPGLWLHCCEEHDLRYWFGGSRTDMDKTDLRLKACVKEVAGENWSEIIYRGVRAGHSSPIKNKTQWSWGWSQERPNNPLDSAEINYVIEEIRRLPFDQETIEKFIELNFKNKNEIF